MTKSPFADLPVLGALPREAAAAKLRELGDETSAARLERLPGRPVTFGGGLRSWLFGDRAWEHTAHAFGFLPASAAGAAEPRPIASIGTVAADPTLRNARLRIVLNRLRVADYPGSGLHRVLIDFYARNQVPGQAEDLHFDATYRVREGEQAPIAGYPVFVGINVGTDGVALRCHTVNVKNDGDEALLDFLEGDVFKAGLKLAETAQPAIAPLSQMALGITKSLAQRNRNVSVQDFYLGLDFAGTGMGARLAQGDYIAVQIPETLQVVWSWDDWVYDPRTGHIVSKAEPTRLIPYNYLVFGVTRYEGS